MRIGEINTIISYDAVPVNAIVGREITRVVVVHIQDADGTTVAVKSLVAKSWMVISRVILKQIPGGIGRIFAEAWFYKLTIFRTCIRAISRNWLNESMDATKEIDP